MWMPRRPDYLRRVALRAAWRLALLVAGKLNGYGRTRPTGPKKAHGPETPKGVRVCERRRPQAAAWDVWAIPRRQALSALGQDRRQWTRGGGQSFFSGVR
ncbi:hypothetical protein CPAR01_05131 [Colletotrichum paranaense]|uniref:Secreted protein n=1 Tax=Colletotrichum paranaense TaxID=1914294 RepID=A0ABQ9SQE3_9PEZI|nr:uncharacterized protein CPAR01_05131 [Colletotrichum paranaense]KAK1541744.1 hypothetical protein CPAR01_05131 [Colletotrichum paranaense]